MSDVPCGPQDCKSPLKTFSTEPSSRDWAGGEDPEIFFKYEFMSINHSSNFTIVQNKIRKKI